MIRNAAALFGAVLSLAATTAMAQSTYKVVYAFQTGYDGAFPAAAVTDFSGTLYGTTENGGTGGGGTIFSLNPATGTEQIVYSFPSNSHPQSSLLNFRSALYGTTQRVGAAGKGTVFALNPSTAAVEFIYAFSTVPKGTFPEAGLTDIGAVLYGTTSSGGNTKACNRNNDGQIGCGTVFSLKPSGTGKVLHVFQAGSDGDHPSGNLLNVGGIFYGMTERGGTAGAGTVFSIDPATGAEKIVYSFTGGADGAGPVGGLIEVGSKLYGTTSAGGKGCDNACGTVFSFDPATGREKVLHDFAGGTDGYSPEAGLIKVGNKLYGTTYRGGSNNSNAGTVFSVDLATGTEVVEHVFLGGNDGAYPVAALTNVGGTLYGTTTTGGGTQCFGGMGDGCGTVFSVTP